jgi:hypothetical protein
MDLLAASTFYSLKVILVLQGEKEEASRHRGNPPELLYLSTSMPPSLSTSRLLSIFSRLKTCLNVSGLAKLIC